MDEFRGSGHYLHWGRLGRSLINGVYGDYLARQNNPLAIKMGFYDKRRRLKLNECLSNQLESELTNKLVVFVHGLTNLESIWEFPTSQRSPQVDSSSNANIHVDKEINGSLDASESMSYGRQMQENFGYTPFYLRYNSGLEVAENAKEFSCLLQELVDVYPLSVEEITLVGFSMGGLVIRQAQCEAQLNKAGWLSVASKCFYVASPHEGAPLEKFGYLAGEVVKSIPRDYISVWADWIEARSEGIQNLRHGAKAVEKVSEKSSESQQSGFAPSIRHYFVSGSLSRKEQSPLNFILGDGLVRSKSSVPSDAPVQSLRAHFEGVPHIALAHCEKVGEQICRWIEEDEKRNLMRSDVAPNSNRRVELDSFAAEEPSEKELIAGALDILSHGYDKTIGMVESMHCSIAKEPFSLLSKIPAIAHIAYPVEVAHGEISGSVYKSLKVGGRISRLVSEKVAGKVADQLASRALPSDKKAP